jgi:predicted transcriptional regulator
MTTTTDTIQVTPDRLKRLLKERGVRYRHVATAAGVSWSMVYLVVGGRRRSARVMGAISQLVGQPVEMRRPRRRAA